MPKSWAKGLTKETDGRVARAAQAHRGKKYHRRTPIALCKFHRAGTVRTGPLEWSAEIAYAVGLVATDGCLAGSRTRIDFTSCDLDLVETFLRCVGRPDGHIWAEKGKRGPVYRARFGDLELYRWLESVGLTPRKSLTLASLAVPVEFIAPAIRGLIDGDGSVECYVHKPIKKVDRTYGYQRLIVSFSSASRVHCEWVQEVLRQRLKLRGAIHTSPRQPHHDMHQLKYGKHDSIKLLTWVYENSENVRLERKFAVWRGFVERETTGAVIYRRASTHRKTLRALADAEKQIVELSEWPE